MKLNFNILFRYNFTRFQTLNSKNIYVKVKYQNLIIQET